jgi:hypothetical protein
VLGLVVVSVILELPLVGPALRAVVWCLGLGALITALVGAVRRAALPSGTAWI